MFGLVGWVYSVVTQLAITDSLLLVFLAGGETMVGMVVMLRTNRGNCFAHRNGLVILYFSVR